MILSTVTKEHYVIVKLKGRVDVPAADDLYATLTTLYQSGSPFLIVDCEMVDFLSSAGMRQILVCVHEIRSLSGHIFFTGFNARVLEVLELSGIRKYIELYPSLEEAEKTMAGLRGNFRKKH